MSDNEGLTRRLTHSNRKVIGDYYEIVTFFLAQVTVCRTFHTRLTAPGRLRAFFLAKYGVGAITHNFRPKLKSGKNWGWAESRVWADSREITVYIFIHIYICIYIYI